MARACKDLRGATLAALVALGALAGPAPALSPATISNSFGASSIALNTTMSLSFTIGNPNPGTGLTNLGFADALPAGLVVATPNGVSDDCGGTVTATAGSTSVSLSGGAVAAGSLCFLGVNVHSTANGKKENAVTVNSSAGTGNTSTAVLQVGSAIPPGPRVYWTNLTGSVAFANLDGSGGADIDTTGATVTDSSGGSWQPDGVALDLADGRVYWTTYLNNKISYANLDGSGGAHDLSTTGAAPDHPNGIVVDQADGRIYWGNNLNGSNPGSIDFAKLDGSSGGQRTVTGINVGDVTGLAVDPVARRVYWGKNGGDPSNNPIAYADLDTGAGHDLVTTGETAGSPHGVAAPPAATRMYVAGIFGLSTINLDNSGGNGLNISGAPNNAPWGIAIDLGAGRFYWANSDTQGYGPVGANTIGFANLDNSGGGGSVDTTGASINEPTFLAVLELPAAAGAPVITGGSAPGSALTCSQGTWGTDVPSAQLYRSAQTFAYSWSSNGQPIAGATTNAYTAPAYGDYTCTVTAGNFAGSTSQTSAVHAIPAPTQAPPGSLGSQPPGSLPTRPILSSLAETNATFAVAARSTALTGRTAAARHRRGTVFSFRLDQPATVRIAIRATVRRATRTVVTLTRTAHAGLNKVAFSGRIRGKAIAPRRYRAVFTASDSAGSSAPKALRFTIVKRA